ncbi:MAG: AIR synthase-related protein [Candidatus Bathyarchaeota archaeon]|nr:AIR synthase-related protein [Candidatus Bathyarchaeota archaeon]
MGKLSTTQLQKLLGCIKKDPRVVVAPQVGYDAGVHCLADKYVAVATDPCTGVPPEHFGYLLVNYAASDVSLFGAKPEFCTITLMGPRPTDPTIFEQIMQQTCRAADELDIAIVRGHTGMYDSLSEVIGVCTVYGTVAPEGLVTPNNAEPGDYILCTKPIGLETAVNFALTCRELAKKVWDAPQVEALKGLVRWQSCVGEALALAQGGVVRAMHDATEGGLVTALNELADASNVGFEVCWEKIPLCPQAQTLQGYFGLSDTQLLSMSSTGTIIAAVNPKAKEKTQNILTQNGLQAQFIGKFTQNPTTRTLTKNNQLAPFPKTADDPYTMLLLKQKQTA